MGGRTILYRGSLKSCNYRCSYCPFSKRPQSVGELERDREQWISLTGDLKKYAQTLDIRALLVVPYGEALIHPWYWDGLAQVSRLPVIDAVGAQTNLSFPVRTSVEEFVRAGGETEKLRIWATFHPQMTTVSAFAEKCRQLRERGVMLSAGAVGVPENTGLLSELRDRLPEEVYLWINRMDGLKRAYTPEEEQAFLEIDPYFSGELAVHPAEAAQCGNRIFMEGNGRLRLCNISRFTGSSWRELCERETQAAGASAKAEPLFVSRCGQKRCSCFLAYGGRENLVNRMLFGPYPLFRIPRRPKAVFLDIAGTLTAPETGDGRWVSDDREISRALHILVKENARLFFATTLPYREAIRRCRSIRHLFCGGVFSAGAHIVLQDDSGRKERFYYLDEMLEPALSALQRMFSFRLLVYRSGGRAYKMTLLRSSRSPWGGRESKEVIDSLPPGAAEGIRYVIEGGCLQIVSARADKAAGVKTICEWLGISASETFAAGDSEEDAEMIKLCGD